jgi:uncharacterized protein (TIGR02145 family)
LAHPSAGLDVDFSNKGFLMPRMTVEQISSIVNPADGLMAYCTTDHKLYIYLANNLVWKEIGFGQGNIPLPFSCGNLLTDVRDGQTYLTMQIGSQCWMQENLNFGTRINGDLEQVNNNIAEKYCYGNLETNCGIYGGLYQWAEMVQYLNGTTNSTTWNPVPTGNIIGLCPEGWHIPNDSEWSSLGLLFGGEISAGGAMKETGTEHWAYPNTGATNISGFSALPGGNRYNSENFGSLNYFAFLWTSTQKTSVNAWIRSMHAENEYLDQTYYGKSNGCSVRCVLN